MAIVKNSNNDEGFIMRACRKELGYTQAYVAKILKCSQSTISRIELGRCQTTNRSKIKAKYRNFLIYSTDDKAYRLYFLLKKREEGII